jgi:hypothetical protein
MNGQDEFEKRLKQLPLRRIPTEWRGEILGAARESADFTNISASTPLSVITTFKAVFSSWLWPHPKAWGALGMIWLLVLGLNLAAREPTSREVRPRASSVSAQVRDLLQQQKQLFAELMGPKETPVTDRRHLPAPKPRSERREEIMNA